MNSTIIKGYAATIDRYAAHLFKMADRIGPNDVASADFNISSRLHDAVVELESITQDLRA